MLSENPKEQADPDDYDEVLELMRGHWECLEAAVRGEELFALELALRDDPGADRSA
jgi:hypothetical protein